MPLAAIAALCAAIAEKSASNNAVTCGASLTARTIFSAILSRIRSCGMSRAAKCRGWAVAGLPALTVVAEATARSTSSRVIRPSRPVPWIRAGSMLCWSRARRTEGERRVPTSPRRRPEPGATDRCCVAWPDWPSPRSDDGMRSRRRIDPRQQRARLRLVVGVEQYLGQHARRRRRHFLRDLVRLELDQRIILEHQLADAS